MKNAFTWLVSAFLVLLASCADPTEPESVADVVAETEVKVSVEQADIPEAFLLSPAVVETKPEDGEETLGTSTADCGVTSPDVSCSGSTWSGVNRNCVAGEPGHVTCDGVTTSCPACACTEGAVRYSYVGICCCDYTNEANPVKRQLRNQQICINGEWRSNGTVCNAGSCPGPGACAV